jgi:hypothetical protein
MYNSRRKSRYGIRGGVRRASSRKNKMDSGPSSLALSYKGQTVSKWDKNNTNTVSVVLRQLTTITSSAGSQIENVFSIDNPNGSTNFSTYAEVFDEYRVLSSEISYEPSNQYTGASTTIVNPLATVLDRDGAGPLTGFNQALGYGSFELKNLSRKWTRSYKMDGTREAVFLTTASPGSTGDFLIYAGGLTASTAYGYVVQTWRVQFRGAL